MTGGDRGLSGAVLAAVGKAPRRVGEHHRGALSGVAQCLRRLLRGGSQHRRGHPLRVLRGRDGALGELRCGIANDLDGTVPGVGDLTFDHCRLRLASQHHERPPLPPTRC